MACFYSAALARNQTGVDTPYLGRFLQSDPIGTAGGMNLYAYAGSDPVNASDPSGLYSEIVVIGSPGGGFDWSWGWDFSFYQPIYQPILPPFIDIGNIDIGDINTEPEPGKQDPNCDESAGPCDITVTASTSSPFDPISSLRTGYNYYSVPSYVPQMEQAEESTLDKSKRCASAQLGLGDLAAAGAAVSGFNILETRGKFAGATPGTSIASRGASAAFGQTRLPFRVPTIVGNPLTLSVRIRATSSVARIVGRGIPVVGWGLLTYDAAKIAQCVASND